MQARKLRLHPPEFLSGYQSTHIAAVAIRSFRRVEDREDFMQTAYEFCWVSFVERGCRLYGVDDRADIDALDECIIRSALTATRRRTSMRHTELEFADAVEDAPLGELLDRVVNPNPKFAAQDRQQRLRRPDGSVSRFSVDELCAVTGMTRDSLWRSRRLRRPIRFYEFAGKVYKRLIDIQREHGVTQATARWRSKPFEFRWDDAG